MGYSCTSTYSRAMDGYPVHRIPKGLLAREGDADALPFDPTSPEALPLRHHQRAFVLIGTMTRAFAPLEPLVRAFEPRHPDGGLRAPATQQAARAASQKEAAWRMQRRHARR